MTTIFHKRGFTLIECACVIATIGTLIGILSPSFAQAFNTASNHDAEVQLNAVWTAARRGYLMANPSVYPDPTTLANALAPEFQSTDTFTSDGTEPSSVGVISVDTDSDRQLLLCTLSSTGTYLTIRDDGSGQPLYGTGDSCTSGANPASPGIAGTAPAPAPNESRTAGWIK